MGEPTTQDSLVEAVGAAAKRMLGRTPGNITAIRPLKDGVIADFQVTEKMLQHFIRKVHENSWFQPSPRVLVCVPCLSTEVENCSQCVFGRALVKISQRSGVSDDPGAASQHLIFLGNDKFAKLNPVSKIEKVWNISALEFIDKTEIELCSI